MELAISIISLNYRIVPMESFFPPSQDRLLKIFKEKVESGEWAPGERIPKRNEIAKEYNFSLTTVHKVFEELARIGYISCQGRRGTFLSENLPYLNHFLIIFPCERESTEWSPYFESFYKSAMHWEGEERFSLLYGSSKDILPQLRELHAKLAIAGAFVLGTQWGDPLELDWPVGLPWCISSWKSRHQDEFTVVFNHDLFVQTSLDILKENNATSLCVFDIPTGPAYLFARLQNASFKLGWNIPPSRLFEVHPHSNTGASSIIHILSELEDRPDGILIMNDQLIETVKESLRAFESSWTPVIVSHANKIVHRSLTPDVIHVTYNVPGILESTMRKIKTHRSGGKVDPTTPLEIQVFSEPS